MTYTVIWDTAASESLQRIYDAAEDKEGIKNAATRIGLELGERPLQAGESRDEHNRVLFKYPLVVWYQINPRLNDVIIYQVGQSRR